MSDDLEAALAAGLRWLYDTEQPEGAILQSNSGATTVAGNRRFMFGPCGWASRPVVVVDVVHVEWTGDGRDGRPANPLLPGELDDLTASLAALGADVAATWNGHPGTTGSLGLARLAHPTLLAAAHRYTAGCPDHPNRGVFCDCGWYANGYRLIVRPDWTVSAGPADAAGGGL